MARLCLSNNLEYFVDCDEWWFAGDPDDIPAPPKALRSFDELHDFTGRPVPLEDTFCERSFGVLDGALRSICMPVGVVDTILRYAIDVNELYNSTAPLGYRRKIAPYVDISDSYEQNRRRPHVAANIHIYPPYYMSAVITTAAGRMFAFGGARRKNPHAKRTATCGGECEYHPVRKVFEFSITEGWVHYDNMPVASYFCTTVEENNMLYVGGGITAPHPAGGRRKFTYEIGCPIFTYTPETHQWLDRSPRIGKYVLPCFFAAHKKGIVAVCVDLGRDCGNRPNFIIYALYDFASETWSNYQVVALEAYGVDLTVPKFLDWWWEC